MNASKFIWLTFCSSLFLTLLAENPVIASQIETPEPDYIEFTAPNADTNLTPAQAEDSQSKLINYSDNIGDLAIQEYGCDCAGCRTSVNQMLLQGKLPQSPSTNPQSYNFGF